MIILIGGASHTGKTCLAQALLERYHYPYLSLDHLKMGLIRSGRTALTVFDDHLMTAEVWPIAREIIKTAIENGQNLIIEGCYIPFTWRNDFDDLYLPHIRDCFLIMTRRYIDTHFQTIRDQASIIEQRLDDSCLNPADLIRDNETILTQCREHGCRCILIDNEYPKEFDIQW